MVAQERLAQLRAQIAEVEQDVHAACSAGVALDPPRPTWEEAAGHVWAGGPVQQPLPDAASTTSGGRRRQTSGPAPPSSTSTKMHRTVRYRMYIEMYAAQPVQRPTLFMLARELLVYWNACPKALRCMQHGIILTTMLDTTYCWEFSSKIL